MLTLSAARFVGAEETSSVHDDTCAVTLAPYDPAFAEMLSIASTFGGAAISAAMISAGATSPSEGLIIAGSVIGGLAAGVGPGVGHLYIKRYAWPIGRMGVRLALLGLGMFSVFRWMDTAMCSDYCDDGGQWTLPVMILSSAAYTFLAAWDFATVRRRAREANIQTRKHRDTTVSLSPAWFGRESGGVSVVGRF